MNMRLVRLVVFTGFSLVGLTSAIARTPQTLTFPPIATQSTTNPIFMLGATASSGLAVSYKVVAGQNIATVSGNVVTLTGIPGPVTIRANQWGDINYSPSPQVFQDFTVVKSQAGSPPWKSIAYGGGDVLAVKNDGTLWAWGSNTVGSLGDGSYMEHGLPEQIGTDTNWTTVAGDGQTVALKTDGTLWTWGDNYYGELGNGDELNTNLPHQVGTSTWKAIAAGYGYTLAIRSDGTLWEAGNGMGSNSTDSFIQIGSDTNWSSASGSYSHAMLVKTDGTLWGMGDNSYGELGIGSTGGPYYGTYQSPIQTGTATNWKSASAGQYFTVAVKTDGTLWSWGINIQDNLGNGLASSPYQLTPAQIGTATNWQAAAASSSDSLALKTDGTLWAWGDNQIGEIGDGTLTPRPSPEQIGTATNWQFVAIGSALSIATKSDGTLWTWGQASSQFGYGFRGILPVDSALGALLNYACTTDHSIAVRSDGTLCAWGQNNAGQLGDGTTLRRNRPEQIGSAANWATVAAENGTTLATKSDGTLWGWGANESGELGDGTTTARLTPEQIGQDTHWKSVAINSGGAAAIKTDGTLWAWGANYSGQLGLGPVTPPYKVLSPTWVGAATNWKSVSVGTGFTVAVRNDGTLWTWGQNQSGELGNGTTTASNFPQMMGADNHWLTASAGGNFVAAVKTDGTLWTWGDDTYGELGNGRSNTFQTLPAKVGGYTDWTRVVAGQAFVLGTHSDGSLWAWGENQADQLGDGGINQQNTPEQIGAHAKWSLGGDNEMNGASSMVTTSDGTLWGWGDNFNSELAGATIDSTVPERTIPGVASQYLGIVAVTAPIGVPVQIFGNALSELPLVFNVSGPAILSGNMLTVTGPGAVDLMGYQPGDENWGSTGPFSTKVTVVPGPVQLPANGG